MSIARMIAGAGQRIIPVEFVGYVHSAGGSATVINGVNFEPGDLMVSYSGSYQSSVFVESGWTQIARATNSNPDLGTLQSVAVGWRIADDISSYTVNNGTRDNLILVFRLRPEFSASLSAQQLDLSTSIFSAAEADVPSDKASAWIAVSNVVSGGVTTSYSGSPLEIVANPDCKFAYKFYPKSNSIGTETVAASGTFSACIAISFAFE